MKVVQINAVCDVGSTGRICRELNDSLIQRGHEGIILYGNGSSDYTFARKVCEKYSVKVHAFLSRVLGKNAAYSPISTRRIINALQAYKPDVVHLHNLHGNYVSLKPLLKYLAANDVATVITLHDCWFFTGKCTYYSAENCTKWKNGCGNCPLLKKHIPSWFFDRTEEMLKEKKELFGAIPRLAVVGVSDWITGEAKQSFLKDARIVERIYNWIDLNVFCPHGNNREKFGISREKFAILCIGAGWNLNTSKTQDLIALANHLKGDCEVVLAGAVDFADQLPENINCVGYLSDTGDLAQLYSACDVYVHLSREDTFGKVIAEAISCGTPAIVYNATACPEIVGQGCGYIVEPGDIGAIIEAIEDVKAKEKKTFESNCLNFVRANFEKDKLIDDTLALYHSLMECGEM